ncbi:MAG: 2'-5' RNA ligase family protein [Halobacteriales archaeon]
MFSLNAPVPGRVRQQLEDLRPALTDFATVREEPTLVVKRFGDLTPDGLDRVESEARLALAGASAVAARLDRLAVFEDPPAGPAPVVYVAVESPGLKRLHDRLVEAFGAVEGLEGDDYVPHVTVARGGTPDTLDRLADVVLEPVEWTVTELWFWDARQGERTGRVSLSG